MQIFMRSAAVVATTFCVGLLRPSADAIAGPLNPDISVIGDIRAFVSEQQSKAQLQLHEIEIALVGPLNPYASAAVFVAFHSEGVVEVEEAKLMLDRYFPAGFGLTAGIYFQDFGQINQLHLHAYPFVFRPLMHEVFFGEDGVRDTGVRVDWIAPIEAFTLQATAGAIGGSSLLGPELDGTVVPAPDPAPEESAQIGASGRLNLFVEASDNVSFQAGSSVLYGQHRPSQGAYVTWIAIDGKLHWDLAANRSLVFIAEGTFGKLDATTDTPSFDPHGWFAAADLRLSKRWSVGAFGESTTARFSSERAHRMGAFAGLALMEESTLFRIVVHQTDLHAVGSDTGILVQALFGLGPHRPHRY